MQTEVLQHARTQVLRQVSNLIDNLLSVVLALETYAGKPGGTQGVRLEEDFVITEDGVEMLSKYPFDEKFLD